MNNIKKNVLLSATALGLVFAFNANAAINVQTGTTDITDDVLSAVRADVNMDFSDGSYTPETWDGENHKFVDGEKTTEAVVNPGDAPSSSETILELSSGSTNLQAVAGGSYVITDPTADASAVNLDVTTYSYTKTAADGTTSSVNLVASDISEEPVLSKTGYDYAVTTAYRSDSATSINIETAPSYGDYKFSDGTNEYNLADFISENGDLLLSKKLSDGTELQYNIPALTDAGTSLSSYGTDTTKYEQVLGYYNDSNTAYGTAVGNEIADQALVDAGIESYRQSVGEYQAKKDTYDNYTTENAKKVSYDSSLSKTIDEKAEAKADVAEQKAKNYTDTAVNTEATDRSEADATLQANIDTEAENRSAADTALQENIVAEAEARSAADTALQENIDKEVKNRSDADADIYAKIGEGFDAENTVAKAIADEAIARSDADADIYAKIGEEATARSDADAKLEETIEAEVNRATGVEGDMANLEAAYEGNLAAKGSTIAQHFAAVDARMGKIHGLFDGEKVNSTTVESTTGAGSNLAKGTTVEDHLVSLDNAIGDRTNLGSGNTAINDGIKTSVAAGLKAAGDAIGDVDFSKTNYAMGATDLSSAIRQLDASMAETQAHNEARFDAIDHRISSLRKEMREGLAATAALAGLVPLDNTYKSQLSMAMGGYENKQAVALGGFHYLKENIILNAGVSYGGSHSTAYKVGVTFGF